MDNADLVLVARVVLGATFVLSGSIHILQRRAFLFHVLEYGILPLIPARAYAGLTPWVEVIAGLMVLFGIVPMLASAVLLLLLASFGIAVTVSLLRGRRFGCGCFGGLMDEEIGPRTLLRIAGLGVLALLVVSQGPGGGRLAERQQGNEIAAVLIGAFVLFAGYIAGNAALLRTALFPSGHRHPTDQEREESVLEVGAIRVEEVV